MPGPLQELADAVADVGVLEIGTNESPVPSGNRRCPICSQIMRAESHGAVKTDCCPKHGVWLDNGELESILRQARPEQMESYRRLLKKAKKDGKISGMLLGAWSLLFKD